jgi:hypothetical protein
MFEDGFLPLSPLNFFELGLDCHSINETKWKDAIDSKSYLLPDMGWLTNEENPYKFYLGWCDAGIAFMLETKEPFDHPEYPNVSDGDSLDLFFDTRDLKNVGSLTRFCHHFYFLPHKIDTHDRGEITRFRQEEAHELCDPKDLELHIVKKGSTTKMKGFIPKNCLFGFDPNQFKRLGFSYRINQKYTGPIHFSVKSQEYNVEQESAMWASLNLK